MSKPLKAEIVKASQIKFDDQIHQDGEIFVINDFSHKGDLIELYYLGGCFTYQDGETVSRILPEPIESTETWWVSVNGYREYAHVDKESALKTAKDLISHGSTDVAIEHWTETFVSRKEVIA